MTFSCIYSFGFKPMLVLQNLFRMTVEANIYPAGSWPTRVLALQGPGPPGSWATRANDSPAGQFICMKTKIGNLNYF